MKNNYVNYLVAFFVLLSYQTFSQVDVTFKVDMSAETVSADGVHVVGSINGWNTTSNPLTQEGSTSIYSATIQVNPGWHEFKYLNGNAWGTEETANLPCAASNGNRFLYINESGEAVNLTPVPFGGCNDASTGFTTTFNIDLSSESSISENGVHMAGSLNGWSTDNLQLINHTGSIYSVELRLPTPSDYPVTYEYKYLNGNVWGTDETPDASCEYVAENNRLITVTSSGSVINDVFNACSTVLGLETVNGTNPLRLVYHKNTRSIEFLNLDTTSNITSIRVFDINGRLIKNMQQVETLSDESISFQSDTNGIYFVQITNNSSSTVQKIIVY
ncbi:hypothetical protein BWZ22_03110 [Seonamhaeicola sp. S2-3]|uniref:T9SS type A sorting domain-containing protein n=1 Tax=Seonamhaeicola sp. S2-3 TaxID=1936081 RepID=UPI000972BD5B|nr:T9SS type A sorting domain-containing protein [Seonamhaeicola sp. S2-3]APY10284.1 hypothetical protein BWZ22_03110 [Seonamhaeicola sp. S2-3]